MPDWREPLPDLPLPPNGRCASAPEVELLTLTIPAQMPRAERERLVRVGRVDRRRQPVAGGVGQLDRLVEGPVRGDADQRPERLVAEDRVAGPDAVDDHRVVEQAGRRGRRRSRARVVGGDPAGRSRSTVWCGCIQPRHSSNRSANLSSSIGPISTSPVGSPTHWRLDGRGESCDELVVHRLVHDHRAERRAALTGGAEARRTARPRRRGRGRRSA